MNEKLAMDDTIIITLPTMKDRVVTYLTSLDNLVNTKVLTLDEVICHSYFSYDEKAIFYLMHKYHLKYDNALMYIENMYYVTKDSDNAKISKVYQYKKELEEEGLLERDPYFKDYLNGKKIIVYNVDFLPCLVKNILPRYEVINDLANHKLDKIYGFETLDDEANWVVQKISELIKKGIDINHIYLTNLNDEYRLIIHRLSKIYNLPISLKDKLSIYGTSTAHLFLELYESDISNTLRHLKEEIKPYELDIYNAIVRICNKYVWCADYLDVKELIVQELKHTYQNQDIRMNSVQEVSFGYPLGEDDYLFVLGFNQGSLPIVYKDEDYFSDKEKEILGMETSIAKNAIAKEETINALGRYNHLFVSYKLATLTDTFMVSSLNDTLKCEIIMNEEISYNHSNLYNELSLAGSLDAFHKFGLIRPNLELLYSNYPNISYRSYDNKFKGIQKEHLYKYLNDKLLLSYSSLDNYHRCAFRYYLANILKIKDYEETFMQFIGNLFHYVLSKAFLPDFDFDKCFDNYIQKDLSKKETFFIKKLKEELRFIIDTIMEQNTHTSLTLEKYEEKVYINLEGNIKVTFMGIIDKLKYQKVGDKYVVAIIDYKTGNPDLNLNNTIYGIEMQLPIYLYLAKNYPGFDHIEVAGFYLQKILHNEIVADKKHKYEALKKNNLLLQGYSNSDVDILSLFDDSYNDSVVVKNLKTTKNGFYSYAKVLDKKMIDNLVLLAEDKIKEATNKILEADFSINPKRIDDKNIGCLYCPFSDICFKTEKDFITLKSYNDLSFIGGDENE